MREIYYVSFIIILMFLTGCQDNNKTKELELKEREIELKERELELAAEKSSNEASNSEATNLPAANTHTAPVSSNSSSSGSLDYNEYSYSNYGVINGDKVIFRGNHSTKSKFLGSFNRGERVEILDEYFPTNDREAISTTAIPLSDSRGRIVYTLVKGKALEVLSESGGQYNVRFVHPQYGRLNANVSAYDLEFISGEKWYKVKRTNGQIGWVFSKYLTR